MATFPILAHFGYAFWRYYNDYGVAVFRSGDWGIGLWLTITAGSLAVAGAVLSRKAGEPLSSPPLARGVATGSSLVLLLGPLVLLGALFASGGGVQSFQTSSSGGDWRAIGPEGVDVTSIAISPAFSNDRTLFVGLSGWDLGVFRSTDGGDIWEEIYEGLRGPSIPWVVVSPAFVSDKTLFAGRGTGGVFRSTDGGDSWKKVTRGLSRYEDVGQCCGYYQVSDLVLSPSFASYDTVYLGTLNGLFRSTDRGDTWQNVSQDLTDTWMIHVLLSSSFAIDNTLFALARNPNWDTGPSLLISTDRGDTWRQTAQNLGVDWGRWASTRLVISPSFGTDGTLYAATKDGLLRSSDQGANWQNVYSYDEVSEGNFSPWVALSPNFATDNSLFTSKVCGGLFRSSDRGETWQEVGESFDVPGLDQYSGHHTCDPPGFTSLVFSPSYTSDKAVFVWTEAGLFQLSELGG